jgi:hypothetical protein
LKEHHRVGLLLAGPNLKWLEPRSGSTQRWNLLCALAAARPGVRPLADLITLRPPVRTGSLIIITPTCDPLWVASIEKFRHNGQVKVLLVNSGEFGVSADQRRVTALLSKRGISYSIIPEALLDEAYSLSKNINRKLNGGFETHKRYVEQGRSNWQNID